jgi:hypothetical protein
MTLNQCHVRHNRDWKVPSLDGFWAYDNIKIAGVFPTLLGGLNKLSSRAEWAHHTEGHVNYALLGSIKVAMITVGFIS